MAETFDFDEDASRAVEAILMTPDVVAQRYVVLRALEPRTGERLLDVGSGPGLLAYDMAATVGSAGRVCGVDLSESMLTLSRRRCSGQPWTEFQRADATHLPYPDASFDAAVSTQVYEYVEDVDAALAELFRVLRPGGRAVILDTDWATIVWHTEDRARMNRVLAAFGEHATHLDLPRTLTPRLRRAGFAIRQRDVYTLLNPEYHANTYSYGLAQLVAGFTPGRSGVTEEEVRAWLEEQRSLGEAGAYFFSLNRYLFIAGKSEA